MSHTPGPWAIAKSNAGVFVRSEAKPGYLAEVRDCFGAKECAANARLIAAAPDLLAALRGLIAEIGVTAVFQDHPAFNAARAAIAKATGADK